MSPMTSLLYSIMCYASSRDRSSLYLVTFLPSQFKTPQVFSHGHVNIILSFAFYAFFLIPYLSRHGPQFPCGNKGLVIVSTGGSFPRTVCYYDFSCVANEVVVMYVCMCFGRKANEKESRIDSILSWMLASNMIH